MLILLIIFSDSIGIRDASDNESNPDIVDCGKFWESVDKGILYRAFHSYKFADVFRVCIAFFHRNS